MRKPNPSKATTITSLEQLEQIVRKPARCRIEFGEQKLEVEVVRLRPCEAAVVERILKTPVPPFVAAVGNQPEHYHTEDAAYREELRRAQFTARAVTVEAWPETARRQTPLGSSHTRICLSKPGIIYVYKIKM